MKKLKQITILGFLGFILIQAAKATGLQEHIPFGDQANADTIITDNDIPELAPAVHDPKLEFKNLLTSAMEGDGLSGAKLNPMAVSFVKKYVERNGKGFLKLREKSRAHFDMMDEVFEEHGLPKELKYIAVIESGLKLNAYSRSGAIGPWAFMPAAARQYGLRMGKGRDERLDYVKSTHAAARLLTDLYDRYGDWLLVIAAYNSGPGNVDKAIRKAGGSKDFWKLQYLLPNETMNHVKKFIGAHYIFEGEGGITTLTRAETKQTLLNNQATLAEEELQNSAAYKITGRFNAAVITRHIDMDMQTFNKYNPGFDNEIAVNGKYELRLPKQKMNVFIEKRYQILDESVQELLNPSETGSR